MLADINQFANQLFPPTATDTTTVLGRAEHNGDATTKDITTVLFKDVFLYDGDPANCCILGFHSYDSEPGDASNHNHERRYVMNYASWISPGLFGFGFSDITAFSHEMSETFQIPFVDNATPWWLSQDPNLPVAVPEQSGNRRRDRGAEQPGARDPDGGPHLSSAERGDPAVVRWPVTADRVSRVRTASTRPCCGARPRRAFAPGCTP